MKTGAFFYAFRMLFVPLGGRRDSGKVRGAVFGIVLSLIPVIVVIQTASGMIDGIIERYLEVGSFHIVGQSYLSDFNAIAAAVAAAVSEVPGVKSAVPIGESRGLLTAGSRRSAAAVKGVPPSLYESDAGFARYFEILGGTFDLTGSADILLSDGLAQTLGASVGDTVRLLSAAEAAGRPVLKAAAFTVSGIFDNYINHYAILSPESMTNYVENAAFYKCADQNAVESAALALRATEGVSYVSTVSEERSIIDNSMLSMSYIIILIILSAGALAFIVLYNLTNINIMERTREIATVKVLGFNSRETSAYVLRENVVLSVIGALIGIVAGIFLHMFVMSFISVDMLAFDIRISVWSYLLSFAITVFFAFVANFFMRFKLDRINMAESLKSVE